MTALTAMVILLGLSTTLQARTPEATEQTRERLRNALETRQQMREREKAAIDNDAELQSMAEEMKNLHMRMRKRMDDKLADDAEYQGLKRKLGGMRENWKGEKPARKPGIQRDGKRDRMKNSR